MKIISTLKKGLRRLIPRRDRNGMVNNRMLNSRRGNVMGIISALAIVSIGLGVISMVTSSFYGSIDRDDLSTEGNDTLAKVENATWGGLSMATVIPFILIGIGVISLVMRGFGGSGN